VSLSVVVFVTQLNEDSDSDSGQHI